MNELLSATRTLISNFLRSVDVFANKNPLLLARVVFVDENHNETSTCQTARVQPRRRRRSAAFDVERLVQPASHACI
jgi:hypothetical protein